MPNPEPPGGVAASPGPLLAAGRDADVYEFGPGRVLRRYRAGGEVAAEAELMRCVHRLGYPVPRVYEATGPDLVLERVSGPTMLVALRQGGLSPEAVGEHLADLLHRLHALPPPGGPAGERILHLDLHPDNVILAPAGPVVIDWRNGALGPPDLDLAATALILAEAAMGSFEPAGASADASAAGIAVMARAGLASFLGRAGGDPAAYLGPAVAQRSANPTLTDAERVCVQAAAELVRSLARLE